MHNQYSSPSPQIPQSAGPRGRVMTPAQQQPRRGATPTRGRTGVASTSVSRSSSPAFKVPALPGSSQGYGNPSTSPYTPTHAPGAWSGQAPASVTPAPAMPTGTAPLPVSGYINTQGVPMTPATAAALQSRLQGLNTGGPAPLPSSGYVHPPTPGAAPLPGGPLGANTTPYAGVIPGITVGVGMTKMDGEDDLDGGGDDEAMPAMADDDYSAQANWQTQSKDNLKSLMENLSEAQYQRFEAYRRHALPKQAVRKVIQQSLGQQVSMPVAQLVAGFSKVFVGEIIEKAKAAQIRRGDAGPLSPDHLREAYAAYRAETGAVGAARPLQGKKLFVR